MRYPQSMAESKTYRINEIFYSLQGEGYFTGTPSVFIRFSGCNLHCSFCDTDFSAYTEMTANEILSAVQALTNDHRVHIVLTGGEPTLQLDSVLIDALHETGKMICLETNGTRPIPSGIDWVTCSPKQDATISLSYTDELKVVFTGVDVEPLRNAIPATHYFLQPCSCSNTAEVVAYIKQHPWWHLSLQTHKYIDIP